MSVDDDNGSIIGFDSTDHQSAYVYEPSKVPVTNGRQTKRRKVENLAPSSDRIERREQYTSFVPLLNGLESPEYVALRQNLFAEYWVNIENKIKSILSEANEGTLSGVESFVQTKISNGNGGKVPAAFITTGPNIPSQELLFEQLSHSLKTTTNSLVITLRSGDAPNLKTALKYIIRNAMNQKPVGDDEELINQHNEKKLLNYDLETLHHYFKTHKSSNVVIALQDSEGFDTTLLADLIILLRSWLNRIPFLLVFGIATSIDLFHERLTRSTVRCLHGAQFDVEQTGSILEKILKKTIIGSATQLHLGPGLVSTLIGRQNEHVQSIQTFVGSLKYAYMCHFYANPLSIFMSSTTRGKNPRISFQSEHYEAVRNLPSFRRMIESLLNDGDVARVQALLSDDEVLLEEIVLALDHKDLALDKLSKSIYVLLNVSTNIPQLVEVFMKAFSNSLRSSDAAQKMQDSIKQMLPHDLADFLRQIIKSIESGSLEFNLAGWAEEDSDFLTTLSDIQAQISQLQEEGSHTGKAIRSKYTHSSKSIRTTVIAQKVQLSKDITTLSEHDAEFTVLVDKVSKVLDDYFYIESPAKLFMSEVWLYDSKSPYRDTFTPRPKFAVERALSIPHDYLGCQCCRANEEGLSSTQPATAILYQLYLETGSLINVFDLWSAFFAIIGGEDGGEVEERDALALFYRALADLKLLGMVKPSRKKTDHISKLSWKGL